ncbi:beta strand repeat-containing protein [Cytophaga aurantiaca]|uniref:beta strand repeat-containing protein n=1 Tax=Cytophaga aurantiaca TaxID=29530 RepID=UPI0009FEB356|nr:T9SS type A sorting domain-containing protein [Cytophaga aurantiaca]
MKNLNKISNTMQYVLRVVIFSVFFLALSNISEATHFRYGTMSWEKVSGVSSNTYRITVSQAWRKSFFPGVVLGGTVNTGTLELGDGTTTAVQLNVTSINPTDDWFYGQFVYIKTYPPIPTVRDYTLRFAGCCRISTLKNAADGDYLSTSVINVGTTNNSPVITVNPIKTAQINTITTIPVGYSEPDGDPVTYRLATAAEMGAANYVLPAGTTINATSGIVTFNGNGKLLNEQYALGIIVSDGKTSVLADLIVSMVAQSTPPKFDYGVTPVDGNVFQIAPGQNLSFGVKAFDTDPGSTVFLTAVGLPIGSSFPFVNPANPVATTFSWTPAATQFGTFVINFTATDNVNVQTPSFVTIVVSLKPVFNVPPTPAYGIELGAEPGTPFQFPVQASDPDPLDSVRLTNVINKPATATLTPLPSVAANPTTANFFWNPTVADWGEREIQFEATDSYGDKAYHKISLIVNTPPIFTSTPPVASVIVNQPYSYLITGLDPDIPYGDELEVIGSGVPSWLTFVDNGDGTGSLTGTPSIADAGTHTITLYLEDIYHHSGNHGVPSQIVTITVIPCTIALVSTVVNNVTCNGSANGAAEVLFTGGFGPFTFAWSNGSTDAQLTDAAPGTYTVSITDAYNCSIYDTLVITEPTLFTAVSTHSDYNGFGVTCNGASDGSASIVAAGGVPSYDIVWSTGSTDDSLTGLAAGTYYVTARDAHDCIVNDSIIITEPAKVAVVSSHSDYNGYGVTCKGASNGSASVVAAGGVPAYTINWSNGSTANAVTGLAAGIYYVGVTDANNCAVLDTVIITEPTLVTVVSSHSDYNGFGVTCKGASDGSAAVVAAGGVPAYTVNWSNGSTANAVTGLAAGIYYVGVTDANNCAVLDTVIITEPTLVTVVSSHSDYNGFGVTCKGASTGSASVVAAGGVPAYNVLWSTGSTSPSLTGLIAGTYSAVATDANGCTATASVVLTEPTLVTVVSSHSDYNGFGVTCKGASTGSASVVVTGGVPVYNVLWSTGSTNSSLTGLTAGTYSAVATDANGCTAAASVVLTEPTILTNAISNLSNYSGFNVSCFGGTNGSATSTVAGGVGPYNYLWSNGGTTKTVSGLSAVSYSVIATDKNGCTANASVLLTQPTKIVASITSPTVIGSYNTSCSLDGDGIALIAGTGGVLPYTTSWSTGATSTSIAGLLAGTYSATLTDKNGCAVTSSILLTRPENCNCIISPITSTASYAAYTKVLDGLSNADINAGENAKIVNAFTGNINMNGGNLVIIGNANLQWLNIPNNSKVTILGTVTLNGINFNGANAVLENYGTVIINYGLNVAGKLTNNKTITAKQGVNFNSGSYVVNNGTLNVTGDLNNNSYFANNGLLNVSNTIYNNSNSTMLNNCTTKAKSYFVNSNVVFTNNGTLDVSNDTRFNSATGTIAAGSIVKTKDIYLNGTTLSGATTSCALISSANYTQINQASLNGKISLCDANGFEIKNNLTLLSGANTNCTTCNYTGAPAASTLRDADADDLSSVQTVDALAIYPNPVSNGTEVTISSSVEIVSVNVFDNFGRIVLTDSDAVFNVADLSAGIYLVKIQDVSGNLTTTKLVVK